MKKSKKRTSEQVVALVVSHLFVLPTNKRNKRILLPDNIIISLPRKKEKIKEEERIKRTNEKKIIIVSNRRIKRGESTSVVMCKVLSCPYKRERDGEGIKEEGASVFGEYQGEKSEGV